MTRIFRHIAMAVSLATSGNSRSGPGAVSSRTGRRQHRRLHPVGHSGTSGPKGFVESHSQPRSNCSAGLRPPPPTLPAKTQKPPPKVIAPKAKPPKAAPKGARPLATAFRSTPTTTSVPPNPKRVSANAWWAALSPQWDTYVTYASPYWRLRIGDFRTQYEAEKAAADIRRQFPRYAKEVRVVRDRVNAR